MRFNLPLPHPEKNEKIIILIRRHWFIILVKILFWALAALMPLLFFFLAQDLFAAIFTNETMYPIFVLFVSIYYLYMWLFTFTSFVDYYLDVWIVTNKKIINIEQKGLFRREVSEQKLFRIQDVTSELKGFFSTVINYGTVYVQTAGTEQRFVFKQVARPQRVAGIIVKIVEQEKNYQKLLEKSDQIKTK